MAAIGERQNARRGDHVLLTPANALGTVAVDTLAEVPVAAAGLPADAPGEA